MVIEWHDYQEQLIHFGYLIRKWSLLCRPLFKSRMVLLEVKPKDMLIQMLEKQSVSSVESSCSVLWWRWFYSIWNRWYSLVLFHRSCFEYFQVVGVLKWLIITGEWSMGWCQKRPFHWPLLWKGYWFSDGDGVSICYSLMSGWLICCGWNERILLNSLYCLWVLYRLDVSVSIE